MAGHVTEVARGAHGPANGVTNFYLIHEPGKLVPADAGAPKDRALPARAARALGKASGDLDALLLARAHGDRTGLAGQARATTGAPWGWGDVPEPGAGGQA